MFAMTLMEGVAHGVAKFLKLFLAELLTQCFLMFVTQSLPRFAALFTRVEGLLTQLLHVGVERFTQLGQFTTLRIGETPAVNQSGEALLHVLAALCTVLGMALLMHLSLRFL